MSVVGALFVLAGLCEIGGGYLMWGHVRQGRPLAWALLGTMLLSLYGVVAALQPIDAFGRVYAAYGGVFVALSLAWGSSWTASALTGTTYWAPSWSSAACWSWSSLPAAEEGQSGKGARDGTRDAKYR